MQQVKSLKLEIEELEERIAPTVTIINPGTTVDGPAAAGGGCATAIANVGASPAIDHLPIMADCC